MNVELLLNKGGASFTYPAAFKEAPTLAVRRLPIGGLWAAQTCRIRVHHHHVPRDKRRRFAEGWTWTVDKQIRAAERDLDAFAHGGSASPAAAPLQTPADRMHALLVERADALMGCIEGSPEEAELATLTDAIEAYEAVRWPNGKIDGGKG
jgi:hypothetical protein